MRLYRRKQKFPDGTERVWGPWWLQYHHRGRLVRVSLKTRDKRAAEIAAGDLIKKAELRSAGVFDPHAEPKVRPLDEHFAEFESVLVARDVVERYRQERMGTLRTFAARAKAKSLGDLDVADASRWVGELAATGLSARSLNTRITGLKQFGLSVEKTARAFVVSVSAIMGWRRDARSEKPARVSTKPPANKLPDLVADLARRLRREWPKWGTRRIVGVLARLGVAVSRTSVRAFLRRKPKRPSPAAAQKAKGALVAKHPGHVWFLDFTRVGGLFRSVVVGAVVDGFSRKVLALRVAPREPTALFAVRLVRAAARAFGAPAHLVTDHGKQFTAHMFRQAVRSLGIRPRYGAVHRHGSIAVIERWWKSMKVEYARGLHLFRPLRAIEAKLRAYARWFNEERPHQGLGQRTPDEVHFGKVTSARAVALCAELVAERIDGDRELPVLRLRRAA